ncbi:MAG: hypothetical protein IKC90_08350 [Akkermansia sp.]|nr:hypothetical protein [Akkermansia sp.]
MITSRLHIVLFVYVLLCSGCTELSKKRFPTVNIQTYTSSSSSIDSFKKISFFMNNEKILDLNLSDERYSHVLEQLNSFISDAEEFYISPFGDGCTMDPWCLYNGRYEIAICYTKTGKQKHLYYTPELHLGYYLPPYFKEGAIWYDPPLMIDMNYFLLPEEAKRLKRAFEHH